MPTVRYQIRNEYGLSDPDLYHLADKDDPEAVLEGVAMAGLVGVLRQLGDLAEFAAKMFHDLHEEVMSTGARGHGLILRVQQLEAEFPSIEKDLLIKSSHSQFVYNDGLDWHANLRTDQNLITQGDMPRFILDSYEESRGPPRLFMLDKFDVAGAGACLKRYSNPSFFKEDYTSSGKMEEEMHMEIKPTKIKKKTHWKKSETMESFLAPFITSDLQPDPVSAKVPFRRVKLKCRKLHDSDIASKKSYMEQFLKAYSAEKEAWPENSSSHPPEIIKSIDSGQLIPEAYGTIIKNITDSTAVRKIYPSQSPTRKEKSVENNLEFMNQPDLEIKGGLKYYAIGDDYWSDDAKKSVIEIIPVNLNKSLDYSNSSPDIEYGEPDDIGSDLENYVDALNTIESEVERDPENMDMSHQNMDPDMIDSVTCEQKQHQEPTASRVRDSMIKVEHSPSNSDISDDLTDNQNTSKPEMPDITHNEVQDHDKIKEYESSNHLLPNWGYTSETDITCKGHSGNEDHGNKEDHSNMEDTRVPQDCVVAPFADSESLPLSETKESNIGRDCLPELVNDAEYVEGTAFNHILRTMYQNNNENNNVQLLGESRVETVESSLGRACLPDSGNDADHVEVKVFDHILETTCPNDNVDIHAHLLEEPTADDIVNPGAQHDFIKETLACSNDIERPIILLEEAYTDDLWNASEVNRYLDIRVSHTDDAVSAEPVKESGNLADNLLFSPDTHETNSINDVEATVSTDTEMKKENAFEDVLSEHVENHNVQQDSLPNTEEQNNKTCFGATTHHNIITIGEGSIVADNEGDIGGAVNDMDEDMIKALKPGMDLHGSQEFHDQILAEPLLSSTDDMKLPLNNNSEIDGNNNYLIDEVNPLELESYCAEGRLESLETNLEPTDLSDSANITFPCEMQLHNELSGCILDSEAENQKENISMESSNRVPLDSLQLQDEKPHIVAATDAEILEDHLTLDSAEEEFQDDKQLGINDDLVITSNEADNPKEAPDDNSTGHMPLYSTTRTLLEEKEFQNEEFGSTLTDENISDSGTSEFPGCNLVKQADNDSLDEYVIVEADENNQSNRSEYSVDDARFEIKFEENYLPRDAVLNEHCTEVEESSNPNHLDPLTKCEPQPSVISSNGSPIENLVSADNSLTEPDNDKENLTCSTENEEGSSSEKLEHQESEHFVVLDRQLKRPCVESNYNLTVSQNVSGEHSECSKYENDTTLANVGVITSTNVEPENSVICKSDLELSTHENSGFPSIANSTLQNSDEIPPLPPLPPIKWLGNLRPVPHSLTDDTTQPTNTTNLIMKQTMPDEKHSQENDVDRKMNSQFSEEALNTSSNPIPEVTHIEDGIVKHGAYERPQLAQLLPTFKLEISQHEASSSATDPIMPPNPYYVGPFTEEWKRQYGYEFYGSESAQNLNLPPYGFLYPIGGDPSTIYNYMIPTIDGENAKPQYHSIRDRPRNPLIEAVAAHDKSKLRKVTELDRPSTKPKADDKNSLLEEIKNKSFNLKPANAAKLNFKGGVPSANPKVSAILEKANAIRKACAESDEDDGDSWSDS